MCTTVREAPHPILVCRGVSGWRTNSIMSMFMYFIAFLRTDGWICPDAMERGLAYTFLQIPMSGKM